jgi:hypothetical protein
MLDWPCSVCPQDTLPPGHCLQLRPLYRCKADVI